MLESPILMCLLNLKNETVIGNGMADMNKSPNKCENVQMGLYLLLNLQTSSPLSARQHDVSGHVPEAYFK